MEIQNISGSDIVQTTMNRTEEPAQETESIVQQRENVQEENKGNTIDNYA
ncbi:MAG: hypothetical protein JXK07_00515 [Spirochaetes bacterium]|nr:hypothetical protein [Spirochaetota bacterium]MBN2769502.1 hypothetical protein [Spirochaetota bacterium]HRX16089.1 hypothetical protein [Spirochaetota bacterium]